MKSIIYFVAVPTLTTPVRSAVVLLTLITEASFLSQQQCRDAYNWGLIWTILLLWAIRGIEWRSAVCGMNVFNSCLSPWLVAVQTGFSSSWHHLWLHKKNSLQCLLTSEMNAVVTLNNKKKSIHLIKESKSKSIFMIYNETDWLWDKIETY